MKLSIVIPFYNEQDNIQNTLSHLNDSFGKKTDIEIILVNNGSTDNTKEVFNKELENYQESLYKVVNVPINKGYGHGILTGIEHSTGDIIAWTHADMQTEPKDVLRALELFLKANSPMIVIKGKRKKRNIFEAFFTFGMQIIAFVVLGVYIDDINAQPKMFHRDFFKKYIKDNAPLDFSLDLFLLYQAKKHAQKIIAFPVYFNKRLFGEAKGGGSFKTRIKLIKRTLSYIFKLKSTL